MFPKYIWSGMSVKKLLFYSATVAELASDGCLYL